MLGLSTNFLHCVFENVAPVAAARKSIWVCQPRPPEQPPNTAPPPLPLCTPERLGMGRGHL